MNARIANRLGALLALIIAVVGLSIAGAGVAHASTLPPAEQATAYPHLSATVAVFANGDAKLTCLEQGESVNDYYPLAIGSVRAPMLDKLCNAHPAGSVPTTRATWHMSASHKAHGVCHAVRMEGHVKAYKRCITARDAGKLRTISASAARDWVGPRVASTWPRPLPRYWVMVVYGPTTFGFTHDGMVLTS